VLAYAASTILRTCGIAHLAPRGTVAASFGPISLDNRRILVMQWMTEGITHTSICSLVILATAIDGAADSMTQLFYVVSARILILLAALTTATGARTPVIWFRAVPSFSLPQPPFCFSRARLSGRRPCQRGGTGYQPARPSIP
jgi:hypothetical protein